MSGMNSPAPSVDVITCDDCSNKIFVVVVVVAEVVVVD